MNSRFTFFRCLILIVLLTGYFFMLVATHIAISIPMRYIFYVVETLWILGALFVWTW